MAIQHDYDAILTLAGVDLSDHCDKVEVIESSGDAETTAFGTDTETRVGTKKRWVLAVQLYSDQAASEVSDTLEDLVGTSVAFTAKQNNTTTGATNRQWSGNVILTEFAHAAFTHGTVSKPSYSWPGTGTLIKAVA